LREADALQPRPDASRPTPSKLDATTPEEKRIEANGVETLNGGQTIIYLWAGALKGRGRREDGTWKREEGGRDLEGTDLELSHHAPLVGPGIPALQIGSVQRPHARLLTRQVL